MKQFDLHRFGRALQCHVLSSRKEILAGFLWMVAVFFLVDLFFTELIDMGNDDGSLGFYMQKVENYVAGCVFGILVGTMVWATRIFSNMKTTPQRTTYLLLPVSHAEKYLVRFLHATVISLLLGIAAFILADALRMLVAVTWGRPLVSGIPILFGHEVGELAPRHGTSLAILLAGGFFFFNHACYVLGGTLFRKQPFLMTSGVLFVLLLLVSHVIDWVTDFYNVSITFVSYNEQTGLYVNPWVYPLIVVFYLLAVACYWLSYRQFCRMQVINNKWLNV